MLILKPIGILVCVACAGCNPTAQIPYCENLGFLQLRTANANTLSVFEGHYRARSPKPVRTITDAATIAGVQQFLLERTDGWFIAAGETYDPNSREPTSEHLVILAQASSNTVAYLGRLGVAPGNLETPGCGYEVVRPLSPGDYADLMRLLFGKDWDRSRDGVRVKGQSFTLSLYSDPIPVPLS